MPKPEREASRVSGSEVSGYLQAEMGRRGVDEVPAVEAAQWLNHVRLLPDSAAQPGLPLRRMLRRGQVANAEQRPPGRGRWYIVRSGAPTHRRGSRIAAGRSTVYVFGELEPRELALFSAEEIRVDRRGRRGATVEVIGHGIGFWSPDGTTKRAFATRDEGALLFRLIVAAYSLLGGTAFRVRATGWVEARDVVGQATMMGFTDERFAHAKLWNHDDPRNIAIRDAVTIAVKVLRLPPYRLALRDLHAAALEPGDDAFVYAYRAVEAIRQAITPTGSVKAQWAAMHTELGTSASEYQQLAKVSTVVRHSMRPDRDLLRARLPLRRQWLLALAREAVLRAVEARLGEHFRRIDA